jgi:hypothetical protein
LQLDCSERDDAGPIKITRDRVDRSGINSHFVLRLQLFMVIAAAAASLEKNKVC